MILKAWQKLLLGVGVSAGGVQFSTAGVQEGITWLKSSEQTKVATSLQALHEKVVTLGAHSISTNVVNVRQLLEEEQSTEALVRGILILKLQNEPTEQYLSQVLKYQNEDGGFGHLSGWQSNPLDTAWVLLALKQLNYKNNDVISRAVAYLASQQRSSGAFQVVSLDEYYVTAHALTALTEYLKDYPQYNAVALKTVNFLESKQISDGHWVEHQDQLFVDALLNEAIHPYRNSDHPAREAFRAVVLNQQNADGSWAQDIYTSAIILRSLKTQSTPAVNPISSGISFSIIDAETKANISGATVASSSESTSALTAQTDANGSVVFTDTKAGDYRFTISKEGFGSLIFQVTLRQGESLNLGQIELTRQANVTTALVQGRITDKTTGLPIDNAEVKLVSGITTLNATTNAEGRYQITMQQPAAFSVSVNAKGYVGVGGTGTATAGSTFDFSPQLLDEQKNIGSVSGRIVDGQEQALADVAVLRNGTEVERTDNQGRFNLVDIQAGAFTLTFSKEDYFGPGVSINLPAGQIADVGTIQLYQKDANDPGQDTTVDTGKFEITVVNANGNLINNPTIVAEKLDASGQVIQKQSFSAENDAANNLLLAELTTGRWRLTASHPSYQTGSPVTYTLTKDQTQKVQLKLNLLSYEMKGYVVDSQTNKAISNATVTIYRQDNGQQLFTGKTDVAGGFSAKNLSIDLIRIQIASTPHLGTTRYFDKQYVEGTVADLGEIRLRPLSADTSLPDLKITKTDSSGLTTEQQSLETIGTLKATIGNVGNKAFTKTQEVEILAFADTNNNRIFDEGEIVLGKTTLPQGLDIQEEIEVNIQIQGKSLFRDAPIGVWVDSTKQVAEKDESNNIALTSDAAEIRPEKGTLDAEVVWHYGKTTPTSTGDSSYGSSESAVAAPLEDTNGDGIIGPGDKATVLYVNYFGRIVAIDPSTGLEKWNITGVSSHASPTIADIDKDGLPEIIFRKSGQIHVHDNLGKFKKSWAASGVSLTNGQYPMVGDLDNDGIPEIVSNTNISQFEKGTLISNTGVGNALALADLDGDGTLEIIGTTGVAKYIGGTVPTVTRLFSYASKSYAAIADMFGTGQPNIITTGDGYFTIFSKTGQQIARYAIPNGGSGGTPTIADFDGDGQADMGVAGARAYTVMRSDGSVIWSIPVQDTSSQITGSSIFDFNNDGKFEVVYADEDYFRIYDAATGAEIYKLINSSHTASEAPIVIDADADGHADIFIVSNRSGGGRAGYTAGLRMISGKNKDWANTRNIWNQYSYHVTNINDDLTVPRQEVNSWDAHNTYRANLLLNQNATAAADPTASYIRVNDKSNFGQTHFTVRIGNAGGKTILKGLPVSFYKQTAEQQAAGDKGTLIGMAQTSKVLAAGEYEDLSIDYLGDLTDFGDIVIVANDPGASSVAKIQEYTDRNNTARLNISAGGFESFGLNASLDKPEYQATDTVKISANVENMGSFSSEATVRHSIYDQQGNLIATLPTYEVNLNSRNKGTFQDQRITDWLLTGVYSGQYQVKTELLKKGITIATATNNLTVVSAADVNGLTDTRISSDKQQYPSNGLVTLEMQLQNTSSNDLGGETTVLTEVFNSQNEKIFEKQESYSQLAANALKQSHYQLQLSNAVKGNYSVVTTTTTAGNSYTRTTSFAVLSAAQSGLGLVGALSATPNEVPIGENVLLNLQVQNTGNEVWNNLPLNIRIFKNDDLEPVTTLSTTVGQLAQAQVYQQGLSWKTSGNNGDRITAALTYKTVTGEEKPLAQASFNLTQVPVEVSLPDYKNVNNQLLVYYSCEAGWHKSVLNWAFGKFNYACFSERGATLNRYLNEIKKETGINYKVTYSPLEFKKLMRSGLYNNYWVLGAVEKFAISTNDEIRELSFNGESVLFDKGILDWTNYELLNLADIRYRGHILLSKREMQSHQPVYDNTNPVVEPTGDTLAMYLGDRAKVTASYDGRNCLGFDKDWIRNVETIVDLKFYVCNHAHKYPAVVTADYGDGKPLALSFDLLRSLATDGQSSTNKKDAWKNLLKQSLSYQQVDATKRMSYAPQEPVHLIVKLSANANTQATVVVQLPANAKWLGQGTVTNNQVKVVTNLTQEENQNLHLPIALPTGSGTHAIKVTVYNGTDTTAQPIDSKEYRFLVRGVSDRLSLLDQRVRQWSPRLADITEVAAIKTLISTGKLKQSLGLHDTAIAAFAEAGGIMDRLKYIDAKPARKELDELIRTLQIQWYHSNP
ncbi:carboxypeptidase regulatory-like domain-containing protein [Acinetobacter indicus]|uniref:carboxypeptidase regulatory-like domain-containing protein n=1 Tax=Acinetobacter TaxID=469 RepID=UPI0015D2B2BA|nr:MULTISPECIES: carboxypeptidase regulatory-like domain-containing protein [Acinetobacter]UNW08791.1 carboxypeptidase regulatory-like domain-containing protein [Acinetobacter indicus]